MKYDLIIIGGGPGGLSAGIYAARYKVKTLIIANEIGGLANYAHRVCNYPGFNDISGPDLMKKMIHQIKELDVVIEQEVVINVEKKGKEFIVKTSKNKYEAKKIIFGVGRVRKTLNLPEESKFVGKGVSYCASCDAGFFKDKITSVVGGSDAALSTAILLSKFAKKVYIIYRKEEFFRGERVLVENVEKNKKIEVLFNEEIMKIRGENKVEGIKLKSGKEIKLDGVFIEIGSEPKIEILSGLNVKQNENGEIIVDKNKKTNIEGLYAVGDVTDSKLKQIVTACSDGAIAAYSIYNEMIEG